MSAWSNDQLNAIFIYSATGDLILRVDSTGFYFTNSTDGSYVKIETGPNVQDAVVIKLQPADSSIPGVVYDPAELYAEEFVNSPTSVTGTLVMLSPSAQAKLSSSITLVSQSNDSATDNSNIYIATGEITGTYTNEIGQGTVDFATGSFPVAAPAVEALIDYLSPTFIGVMSTTREYEARFTGTVQSTTAGDNIGLRIYSSNTNASLAGATLLIDYGQIKVATASVPQPFSIDWGFTGLPGKYILLGGRRASGAGTCTVTSNYRKLADVIHS